ncbi:hypothetical protein PHK61_19875 [Actinomycetospora lutea]|uniref:hypothetical protein n=1 Tax=Actinomycetospora lutea TaxID=663604 RepID=UPI0023673DE2|nr:hypothetical protein [Actinomycetospora lutea]MDD7940688.1 hypothetical protein [Actinomycetospora lutea]
MRVVTCGDPARDRWGDALRDLDPVGLPALPARGDVDPLLDDLDAAGRLVVAGDDAALAAVLVRLLRRGRLDVEVAVLPAPDSAAAAVWGLPTDAAGALALARDGTARPAPLVRDDHGGLVAGRHTTGPVHGEVYCEQHRVLRGDAAEIAVAPDPAGGVTVTVTGPRRLGGLRAGRVTEQSGRAVQLGSRPAVTVVRDGVPGDRPVSRRSWYRHTEDWRLVRP